MHLSGKRLELVNEQHDYVLSLVMKEFLRLESLLEAEASGVRTSGSTGTLTVHV